MNRSALSLSNPRHIALAYFLFGISWIVITDGLVLAFVESEQAITAFQTAKGWVFVGLSTLLLYGLVRAGARERRATNEKLERALRQTNIYDRLLRHNLRNSCSAILGQAELIESTYATDDDTDGEDRGEETTPAVDPIAERTAIIKSHIDQLTTTSEKSRYLRDVILEEDNYRRSLCLRELLEDVVADVQAEYPDCEITIAGSDELMVTTTPRLRRALAELLENAIDHNVGEQPRVTVSLECPDDGTVSITIEDNGPGIPDMEQQVLQRGEETPLSHSAGLGLWISRAIVTNIGGRIDVSEHPSGGTVVSLSLPTSCPNGVVGTDFG